MADKKEAPKKSAPVKKKAGSKLHKLYTILGDKISHKNRSCPKCGQGTFLANHATRLVCGKCQYVEYVSKK